MGRMEKLEKKSVRNSAFELVRQHCVPLMAISPAAKGDWTAPAANLKPVSAASVGNGDGGDPRNKKPAVAGGSALLWETLEGRFLVTAFHVWSDLMGLVKRPNAKHHLFTFDRSGPVLIVEPTLVSGSEKFDIAVFSVEGIMAYRPLGKTFLRSNTWPNSPVEPGETIIGAGFPGCGRFVKNAQHYISVAGFASNETEVSASGERILIPNGG